MKRRAFTLIEIMVAAGISSIMAVGIFALLNAGMILSAKNLSVNLTSNSMRTALDRVEQIIQEGDQGDGGNSPIPRLISNTGADVAAGSAAGVKFDRFLGSPFVVTLTSGAIPASSTTLVLTSSTHSVASPPPPKVGDIIRIATTLSTLRPRIAAVSAGAITSQRQPYTVTLTAPLGTTVTPLTATVIPARLVRNVAFIVMPNGGKNELRYYHTYDTTTNLNDPTRYDLITDQIGTGTGDNTPFSIVTVSGQSFVNFALRVRASNADQGMRGQQRDQFNTYSRADTLIRPKNTQ